MEVKFAPSIARLVLFAVATPISAIATSIFVGVISVGVGHEGESNPFILLPLLVALAMSVRCLRAALFIDETSLLIRNPFRSYVMEVTDVVNVSERGLIYKWLVLETTDRKIPVSASLVVMRPTSRNEAALREALTRLAKAAD